MSIHLRVEILVQWIKKVEGTDTGVRIIYPDVQIEEVLLTACWQNLLEYPSEIELVGGHIRSPARAINIQPVFAYTATKKKTPLNIVSQPETASVGKFC